MKWYDRLKFARKVKNKTLREVENEVGISNAYLSQLETGKIKEPGFFVLIKLVYYYNLDVKDMIDFKIKNGVKKYENVT